MTKCLNVLLNFNKYTMTSTNVGHITVTQLQLECIWKQNQSPYKDWHWVVHTHLSLLPIFQLNISYQNFSLHLRNISSFFPLFFHLQFYFNLVCSFALVPEHLHLTNFLIPLHYLSLPTSLYGRWHIVWPRRK